MTSSEPAGKLLEKTEREAKETQLKLEAARGKLADLRAAFTKKTKARGGALVDRDDEKAAALGSEIADLQTQVADVDSMCASISDRLFAVESKLPELRRQVAAARLAEHEGTRAAVYGRN